jgi:hypothetical protein
LFFGTSTPQFPLALMRLLMVSIFTKSAELKLVQPRKGLLPEPVPQLTVTPGLQGPGEIDETNNGFGPIFKRIISFLPSLLPSQASTRMLTISKHLVGIDSFKDELAHGCACTISILKMKNKIDMNRKALFIE